MDCRDCPRFDFEREICQDGKVNPQRRGQVVEFVNTFGIRALCPLNEYREWLVETRTRVVGTSQEEP